jgi:hypothetical protein
MGFRHASRLRNPVCIGVRGRRALLRAFRVRRWQCACAAGNKSRTNHTVEPKLKSHDATGTDDESKFAGDNAVNR